VYSFRGVGNCGGWVVRELGDGGWKAAIGVMGLIGGWLGDGLVYLMGESGLNLGEEVDGGGLGG